MVAPVILLEIFRPDSRWQQTASTWVLGWQTAAASGDSLSVTVWWEGELFKVKLLSSKLSWYKERVQSAAPDATNMILKLLEQDLWRFLIDVQVEWSCHSTRSSKHQMVQTENLDVNSCHCYKWTHRKYVYGKQAFRCIPRYCHSPHNTVTQIWPQDRPSRVTAAEALREPFVQRVPWRNAWGCSWAVNRVRLYLSLRYLWCTYRRIHILYQYILNNAYTSTTRRE